VIMAKINTLLFSGNNDTDKEILRIANELDKLERRGSPHNSIRVLIEEAGQAKIEKLKKAKEAKV